MINLIGAPPVAAAQPAQNPSAQLSRAESARIMREISAIFLRIIDRSLAKQNTFQGRLERQVQEREVALFNVAHENVNLTGRLNEAVRQVEEQTNRANRLEAELAEEQLLRNSLRTQLAEARVEGHLLRAQVENHQRLRDDIQRRLDASELRISSLEQQIATERAAQVRLNRLNELRVQKAQIEKNISSAVNSQTTVLISGAAGGMAVAGPIGALVGFIGSFIGAAVCPCSASEKENLRALHLVKTEMAEIDPNSI